MLAKVVAAFTGGAVFGAVAVAIATMAGRMAVRSKNYPVVLSGGGYLRYALGGARRCSAPPCWPPSAA